MACDCITKVNALLKADHLQLDTALMLSEPRERTFTNTIVLETAPRRTKRKRIMGQFCPFCGVRYEELR